MKTDKHFFGNWKEFASKDKFVEFAKSFMATPKIGKDGVTLNKENIEAEITAYAELIPESFGPGT